MIVYTPLWETMKRKGITTYTLRNKYKMSGSTVHRLKHNLPVSTITLDDICRIIDCSISEVVEHVKDDIGSNPQTEQEIVGKSDE